MASEGQHLVVAVKRGQRDMIPGDWVARLAAIDGVEIQGHSATRAQLWCPAGSRGRVEAVLGDRFHVEILVERSPA